MRKSHRLETVSPGLVNRNGFERNSRKWRLQPYRRYFRENLRLHAQTQTVPLCRKVERVCGFPRKLKTRNPVQCLRAPSREHSCETFPLSRSRLIIDDRDTTHRRSRLTAPYIAPRVRKLRNNSYLNHVCELRRRTSRNLCLSEKRNWKIDSPDISAFHEIRWEIDIGFRAKKDRSVSHGRDTYRSKSPFYRSTPRPSEDEQEITGF